MVTKQKIRTFISWVTGIICFYIIALILQKLVHFFHIPTEINYGFDPYSDFDYDDNIKTTDVGSTIIILPILLSWRIGKSVYEGRFDGGLSKKVNIDFIGWSVFIFLIGFEACIHEIVIKHVKSSVLAFFITTLKVLAFVITGFLCKIYCDHFKYKNDK